MADKVADCMVIGGGLVGLSIAYGVARTGAHTVLVDGDDNATCASRANFGLIWVQGKGLGMSGYGLWTARSAKLWPAFAQGLKQDADIDVMLQQPGGYWLGFDDREVEKRNTALERLKLEAGIPYRMLSGEELRELMPELGPGVVGGSFSPLDGHVNPLKLMYALYTAGMKIGVEHVNGSSVVDLEYKGESFFARLRNGRLLRAKRVVLAAGLGNDKLAPLLGLHAPVQPNRGQVLITERTRPFLSSPTHKLRQTDEGSIQLGSTEEDAGFNDDVSSRGMRHLAKRAVETFPMLASLRIVRAWAGLRIMTPDGFPIYDESAHYPGAFLVTCHSGVTLSAIHASVLAPWIIGAAPAPDGIDIFSGKRFIV